MTSSVHHSTTTTTTQDAPNRNALLATLGAAASVIAGAVGTFWDVTGNETADRDGLAEFLPVLVTAAIGTAIVFGLVVRTAAAGNAGRRALVTAVVGLLTIVVFWTGLPLVLAAGAIACAMVERDALGTTSGRAKAVYGITGLTAALAVLAAIAG